MSGHVTRYPRSACRLPLPPRVAIKLAPHIIPTVGRPRRCPAAHTAPRGAPTSAMTSRGASSMILGRRFSPWAASPWYRRCLRGGLQTGLISSLIRTRHRAFRVQRVSRNALRAAGLRLGRQPEVENHGRAVAAAAASAKRSDDRQAETATPRHAGSRCLPMDRFWTAVVRTARATDSPAKRLRAMLECGRYPRRSLFDSRLPYRRSLHAASP